MQLKRVTENTLVLWAWISEEENLKAGIRKKETRDRLKKFRGKLAYTEPESQHA